MTGQGTKFNFANVSDRSQTRTKNLSKGSQNKNGDPEKLKSKIGMSG